MDPTTIDKRAVCSGIRADRRARGTGAGCLATPPVARLATPSQLPRLRAGDLRRRAPPVPITITIIQIG
eukprot:2146767-Prymnesium_polylepis.1